MADSMGGETEVAVLIRSDENGAFRSLVVTGPCIEPYTGFGLEFSRMTTDITDLVEANAPASDYPVLEEQDPFETPS